MVKYVNILCLVNPVFKALPYGTKLYLKTTDDVIREVKIIGGEFRADNERYVYILYKYQIAGFPCVFFGTEREINYNGICGSLYPKMECITKGISAKIDDLYMIYNFPQIFADYIYKAGNCRKNGQIYDFLHYGGTFSHCAEFYTTGLGANGNVYQKQTPFNLYFDKNGWHGEIPAIDNGEMYHNAEEALSHYKPTIVIFDDTDDVMEQEDEEITISIKIKKNDVVKLKTICEII